MSELGQFLRETREQKGLSLEDLQRTTKIQKRYLLAIEEGRFDTLPGLFYARAFVKTYAEAVGLDPEPLFEQYRSELPNPQKEAIDLPSRSERSKSAVRPTKKSSSKTPAFLPAVIALAFLVVLALGIWLVTTNIGGERDAAMAPDPEENVDADFSDQATEPEEPEADVEPDTEEELVEEEPAVEEEEEEETASSELNVVDSSGNTTFYELEGDRFDVVIQFSGSSYVDVKDAEGSFIYNGTPADGDELTYEFDGEEEVEFNFGASQNVTLIINDEEVEFELDAIHQKVNVVNNSNE
ncbi:helix-turn-helix domain-containing protein [Alkalihalophilus sp. As8PL]|uniref:Helix-turn-helix domain-containing protein n=1 Tax=Alkalihalophilus sp. As8PL TaxID=3237103 RepID=A0AB39BS60_9BACI